MSCRGDYRKYLREKVKRLEKKLCNENDPKEKNRIKREMRIYADPLRRNSNPKEFGTQTLANYSFDDTIDMSL